MSGPEFTEWMRFYELEPFGEFRADLRAGVIAQTVAVAIGGNKNAKPIDFMPIIRKEREDETLLDERAIATRFNAMMFGLAAKTGVKIVKRNKG